MTSTTFSAFRSSPEDQHANGGHHSLDSILETEKLRENLMSLISSAMGSMRVTMGRNDTSSDHQADDNQDSINVEKIQAVTSTNGKQASSNATVENAGSAKHNVLDPGMGEFLTASHEHFERWRRVVQDKIGETIKVQTKDWKTGRLDEPSNPVHFGTRNLNSSSTEQSMDTTIRALYPPSPTELVNLKESKRILLIQSILLLLLNSGQYSAYSRILLLYLISSLRVPHRVLVEHEILLSKSLMTVVQDISADQETQKKAVDNEYGRKWKVGLASLAGAAVIGITGGLAAPLVAAGIGSALGGLGLGATAVSTYLGALASSSVLVGGLFGAYGAKMTGEMMDNYAKEVQDFAFVPVKDLHEKKAPEKDFRRFRVAIGVSGWLTSNEDITLPWRIFDSSIEGFALRFELRSLLNLGNALNAMVKSYAWGYAKSELIKRSIFASLSAGLWPLGLLKISRVVDNPFSIAKVRSDKTGQVLADALINKVQGERPVTLVGYSLGARVIYTCLKTLADRKAFGLIESVVLLGAPTPSDATDWQKIRAVVSGRVINIFSTNDYILGFLYRTSSIQYGVAGLEPIVGVGGVENVNASDIVSGHTQYRRMTGSILAQIGFEDVDHISIEKRGGDLQEEKILGSISHEGNLEKVYQDADLEAEEMVLEIQMMNDRCLQKENVFQ